MGERIGIWDTDQHYSQKFAEYVLSFDLHYDIYLFTNQDSLNEYLETNELDYLFIDQTLCEAIIHRNNIKMIYMLINHPEIRIDVEYPEVFKYQPVKDILNVLSKRKKNDHTFSKVTTLSTISHSIFSLIFAWSYALASSYHRKILFISLDLYPVNLFTSLSKEIPGISDIIYYLKENKSDHFVRWRKLIQTMGSLDYITGVNHAFDLLTLNESDMGMWITALQDIKEYDEIIFFTNVSTPAMNELLRLSHHVINLKLNKPYEIKKEAEWKRQNSLMNKGEDQKEWHEVFLMEEDFFLEREAFTLQELYGTYIWQQAKDYVERER